MQNTERSYSTYAGELARKNLSLLLSSAKNPQVYQQAMTNLGQELGRFLAPSVPFGSKCLVVSTAEDADYLASGVRSSIIDSFDTKAVVFWNNHYALPTGVSVAPIVHRFMEKGYESADTLIVVKSVISGSCVVRTNILALIESVKAQRIYIVSPVMHTKSEENLRKEFPAEIADKFEFFYFAVDSAKDASTGEVKPGIGGQIYQLLGMKDQPSKVSFMPALVKKLAFS